MEREIVKKMAYKWLNSQITAWKLSNKKLPYETFGTVHGILYTDNRELHIAGVQKIADILDIPVIREEWDGNKVCNTNHDIIYFQYRGFKVFELVPKIRRDYDEGK